MHAFCPICILCHFNFSCYYIIDFYLLAFVKDLYFPTILLSMFQMSDIRIVHFFKKSYLNKGTKNARKSQRTIVNRHEGERSFQVAQFLVGEVVSAYYFGLVADGCHGTAFKQVKTVVGYVYATSVVG